MLLDFNVPAALELFGVYATAALVLSDFNVPAALELFDFYATAICEHSIRSSASLLISMRVLEYSCYTSVFGVSVAVCHIRLSARPVLEYSCYTSVFGVSVTVCHFRLSALHLLEYSC